VWRFDEVRRQLHLTGFAEQIGMPLAVVPQVRFGVHFVPPFPPQDARRECSLPDVQQKSSRRGRLAVRAEAIDSCDFRERGKMPTLVKFVGGTDLVLENEFDKVNSQLGQHGSGLFVSDKERRVTVYRENVLYIEVREGAKQAFAAGF
jgi:hypothetical protein